MNSVRFSKEANWLEERRKRLQASEVAGLLGEGYSGETPWSIYMNKVYGQSRPFTETQLASFDIGKRMEPLIRELFTEETGLVVQSSRYMEIFWPEQCPHLGATLDGQAVTDTDGLVPVELKNVGEYNRKDWEDGATPDKYVIQLQVQMACTGADAGYIAALLGGNKFLYRRFERNDRFCELMMAKVSTWWEEHIEAQVAPEMDYSLIGRNQLAAALGSSIGTAVAVDADAEWERLQFINEQVKRLEQEAETIKTMIAKQMGMHEYAVTPAGHAFSWKWQEKKEHKVKASKSRVFRSAPKLKKGIEVVDDVISETEGHSTFITERAIATGRHGVPKAAEARD